MTARSIAYLKSRFENNDIPTATDYEDVFDSFLPVASSGAQTIDGTLTVNGLTSPSATITSALTAGTGTFSGIVSAGGVDTAFLILDADTSVNAAATTQASAKLIDQSISWIATATGNNLAVRLVSAQPGMVQYVINTTTTVLQVYPCVGGAFVGTAANTRLSIPREKGATVIHGVNNTYIMLVGT